MTLQDENVVAYIAKLRRLLGKDGMPSGNGDM